MSGRKLGIVIGTNEYSDSKIRNLRFSEKDAKDIKNILLNSDICGFDKVVEVINENSTDSLGEIEQLFYEAEQDDLILIYFSGHGELDKQNELCLLFKNTKVDRLLATSLNYSMVKKCINGSKCQTTIVILDCCYSGAADVKGNNIQGVLDKNLVPVDKGKNVLGSGTIILSASSEFDVAKEDEKLENGVFTYYLIEGLKSGAVAGDSKGDIELDDLYNYAYEKASKYLQTPYIKVDCKGKIIIGKNPLKVKENSFHSKRDKLVKIYADGLLPSDVYDISMNVLIDTYEKPNELTESYDKIKKSLEDFFEGKIKDRTYIYTVQYYINTEKEAAKQELKEEEEKKKEEKKQKDVEGHLNKKDKDLRTQKNDSQNNAYHNLSDQVIKNDSSGFKKKVEDYKGVMIQAFYWDCPALESCEHKWWAEIKKRIPALQQDGFTAIWLPPVSKAASWKSMGYDPYDYYDLGEFDQKGGIPTWFGSKNELLDLIRTAHAHGLKVYTNMVLNHNSGGDDQEENPIDHKIRWTLFHPKSGKFNRDWTCFHPSPYEQWDNATFGDMPDLCHRNPYVYGQFIEYAKWLLEIIGFDGFCYDIVKSYGSYMIRAIQELYALRDGEAFKPFGVGECWDSDHNIEDWLNEANTGSNNFVTAFDFPLRARLRDLCDNNEFKLRDLKPQPGTLLYDRPFETVTFVENHDVVRSEPIIHDKLLAYAFILTHEGYPCVFWQDYFNFNLAQEGNPCGILALIQIHNKHAGGATNLLYVDNDLYVMQRDGDGAQHGLVLMLNKSNTWKETSVQTRWINTKLSPVAWHGSNDFDIPEEKWINESGWTELWAPPRGYVVYIPQNST